MEQAKEIMCKYGERESTDLLLEDNEVNKARNKDNRVDEIYAVQHFRDKSTELLWNYIDMFLAIKLRASYKGAADDIDAKLCQQAKIRLETGLHVELANNQDNAGLLTIAKLFLNSL